MYRAVALWALRRGVGLDDMHRMEQLAIAAEIELAPGTHQPERRRCDRGHPHARGVERRFEGRGDPGRAARHGGQAARHRRAHQRGDGRPRHRHRGFPRRGCQDLSGRRIRRSACGAASRSCAPRAKRSPRAALAAQMRERDQRDSTRADAPLAQAPDAVYLDSTPLAHRGGGRGDPAKSCGRASRTERITVERSAGHEVRRHQRGLGRADARGGGAGRPRSATKRPVAVVVSAMSKITDLLLDTMRHAEARRPRRAWRPIWRPCAARHEDACRELLPRDAARRGAWPRSHELIGEFERIVNGMAMLGERPPRSVDEAVAIGERLSALLMAEYLKAEGIARRGGERLGRGGHGRRLRQRLAADGADPREGRAHACCRCSSRGCCRW